MKHYKPDEIEARSFEIITEELGETTFDPLYASIIKRVIHTSADFDYAKNLVFTNDCVNAALNAFKEGCTVVTDTNMALSGINKQALLKLNSNAQCFMADEDVAQRAKEQGTTRAAQCMEKACTIKTPLIVAVGNAPTALIKLSELIKAEKINPRLIIAVPVGFVNVVESKEIIVKSPAPCIAAVGRKGGSNVAAAIVNALMYMLTR